MKEAEKKIRSFIRIGKAARIILWCSFILTAVLAIGGAVLKSSGDLAESEKFDAVNSEKETYCYIDVIAVSDWCYKYTYNSAKNTFYVVQDTEGYLNWATISDRDYRNMSEHNRYWKGDTDTEPEPYRIYGEAWPLDASLTTWSELYDLSGMESAEEFEDYFGTMYLLNGYNPIEEAGAGLHLAALFLGLFFAIVFLCCSPKMIKTGKSLRLLKKNGQTEDAALELENTEAVGPCVIGKKFFFAGRNGAAVPVENLKSVVAHNTSLRIRIESLGEIIIENLKPEDVQAIFSAMPINGASQNVVRMKSN